MMKKKSMTPGASSFPMIERIADFLNSDIGQVLAGLFALTLIIGGIGA